MPDLDIIIPAFNIKRRGYERLWNLCYSLTKQTEYFNRVIIVDGSDTTQVADLSRILKPFKFVTHCTQRLGEFNKCVLLNHGISVSDAKWIMTTDCDYIFAPDLLKVCQAKRSEKTFLLKEVKMLPRHVRPTAMDIDAWKFPEVPFNKHGKDACGAMQYTIASWFHLNPYDERLTGMGGMDVMQVEKAVKTRLNVLWVEESEILHQYHNTVWTGMTYQNYKKNMDLVTNYRNG